MKIIWTQSAIKGLNKGIDFTEKNFPENKKKLKRILINLDLNLKSFPLMGTLIDSEKNIYRIVLKTFPFSLTYKKEKNKIYILSWVHQSQKWA